MESTQEDPSHLECWSTYQQIDHVRSNWEAAEHPHVYCDAAVQLALTNELFSLSAAVKLFPNIEGKTGRNTKNGRNFDSKPT